MKIIFNVEYQTSFGENLVLNILPVDENGKVTKHKMTTLDGCHWFVAVTGLLRLARLLSPTRISTIIIV